MAKALGHIKYPAGGKLDYAGISADLGYLLTDIIKLEEDRAKRFGHQLDRLIAG